MSAGIWTKITIGGNIFIRCPRVWVEFRRHTPLSRCGITLPDAMGEQFRAVKEGDNVELLYAYRDEPVTNWSGTVAWIKHGTKDQVHIGAVGLEKPLSMTLIRQSWINESPEAIIRAAIAQSGLPVGRVDSPGVVFPRFVASNIPAAQVAVQCEATCLRAFGIDMSRWALWMDHEGKVNWGDFDEQGPEVNIATGGALIAHLPAGDAAGLSRVETFLVPELRDAMPFTLKDSRRGIDGVFRAQTVRHEFTVDSARTFIWYHPEGVEYGRH